LYRDDEVCSLAEKLESNLLAITSDELQYDAVDADVGDELESNENNNNNNNNSKFISI